MELLNDTLLRFGPPTSPPSPPPRTLMLRRGRKPKVEVAQEISDKNHAVDYAFYQTEKGELIKGEAINARAKKRRVTPSGLNDEFATWTPFHKHPDLNEVLSTVNEEQRAANEEEEGQDGADDVDTPDQNGKRKRYESSDDPTSVWRRHALDLLHELYRFSGLGDALSSPRCQTCTAASSGSRTATQPPGDLFRCLTCCLQLECHSCCMKRHAAHPLHCLQKWNGLHYEATTLQTIGLIYQLGHTDARCPFPDPLLRKITVLDTNGIHGVTFRYCGCVVAHRPSNIQQLMRAGWYPATTTDPRSCATFQVLDLFRLLNVRANVNANDFVHCLEAQTDATGTTKLPDRYKSFARMARQWAFLHRLKRSGVGFSLGNLAEIGLGTLAVICWACPNPDLNLPKDWDTVENKYSYLYMPVYALDANFRLKNRFRANEKPSSALAPGSAYFVDPIAYKDFLKDYVSENDISTCIAFAALLQKDTKLTTGLKTSGVAGCACAHHELIRPQGLGDLQKGERYANVDFVFFSAIKNTRLPRLAISYDIICQWKQKLWERMLRLPKELHLDSSKTSLTFGLPTWHAVAHEQSCRTENALTYQEGVGRTDGEGIERIWSVLNPASYATREMAEGTRHDALDDRIDFHNFGKNLSLGSTLARRLAIAIVERDRQVENFNSYDKGLKAETRELWKRRITDWNEDKTKPNPYMPENTGNLQTEAEVLVSLSAADTTESQEANAPIHGTSQSALLVAGFQLEDIQLKLHRDIRGLKNSTPYQQVKIDLRRRAFFDKLEGFRDLQRSHMQTLKSLMDHDPQPQTGVDPNAAENVRLWFPSDMSPSERIRGCHIGLVELEVKFREARCNDALISLRHYLHAKQSLLAFRNANVTGQNESTRARGTIDSTTDRIEAEAEKYRRSRTALLSLYEVTEHEDYPELTAEDIKLDVITDPDLLAQARLAEVGASSHKNSHASTGTKLVSWVWTALGGPTAEEMKGIIGSSVSIEWCKALARKNRWTEEVACLREEMKRVLRSLAARSAWWDKQGTLHTPPNPRHPSAATQAGMQAYAAYQASLLRGIAKNFEARWGRN